MIGYKGFNKDFQGYGKFQYAVGGEYEMNLSPHICRRGFHFVEKIEEVVGRFPLGTNHRYAMVEALGEISIGYGEKCTNRIKIIREISEKEIRDKIQKNNIRERIEDYLMLSNQYEDLVIGGSLSLILQNVIPYRIINDLDLVAPKYFKFQNSEITRTPFHSEGADAISIQVGEKNFDYFIIPNVLYTTVIWEGIKLKVQLPQQILIAKFRYLTMGVTKHKDDILSYLSPVNLKTEIVEDDMPF